MAPKKIRPPKKRTRRTSLAVAYLDISERENIMMAEQYLRLDRYV